MYVLRDAQRRAMAAFMERALGFEDLKRVVLYQCRGRQSVRGEYSAEEAHGYDSIEDWINVVITHDSVQGGSKHKLVAYGPVPADAENNAQKQLASHTFTPQKQRPGADTGSTGTSAAVESMAPVVADVARDMGNQASDSIARLADQNREWLNFALELSAGHREDREDLQGEVMRLHRELAKADTRIQILEMEARIKEEQPMSVQERVQLYDGLAQIGAGVVKEFAGMFVQYKQLQAATAKVPGGES